MGDPYGGGWLADREGNAGVSVVSFAFLVNVLKVLSNPVVLLSVLLAGSLAFGGCQSKRIAGFKQKAEEHKAQIVALEKGSKLWEQKALQNARKVEGLQGELAALVADYATAQAELKKAQEVREAIEAEKAAALAASNRARRDAESTLRTFMDRYARATRNPDCAALLNTGLCR